MDAFLLLTGIGILIFLVLAGTAILVFVATKD